MVKHNAEHELPLSSASEGAAHGGKLERKRRVRGQAVEQDGEVEPDGCTKADFSEPDITMWFARKTGSSSDCEKLDAIGA